MDKDMRSGDTDLLKKLSTDLSDHIARFDAHESNEESKFSVLIQGQQANIEAIGQLTTQVSILVTDTKDIIGLYKDVQGAARIGANVQSVILWLLKWGVVGSALASAIHYVLQHTKH